MKLKEETEPIKDTPKNQSRAAIVFKGLINKRKELMNDLYDSDDYNSPNFKYVCLTKDVSFYEYMDSKELFDAIRSSRVKFSEALNKQNEFLNKLNDVKLVKRNYNKKNKLIILKIFTFLEEKLLIFLETILKCYQMQITMLNNMILRENDLKY